MSVRLNLVLSDDLNSAIESAVSASETTKTELIRKALQLFLAAQEGKKRGLKIGLATASQPLETEFIGL